MDIDRPERPDSAGNQVPDDLLATTDLLFSGALVPKGDPRRGGVSLGRPLVYALPASAPRGAAGSSTAAGIHAVADTPQTVLVCFPFDLEELPGGCGYREVELAVLFDDEDLCALDLQPRPGSVGADGAQVTAFGLGRNRLRWIFRAPEANGTLRPDGRWTQAVLQLPADFTEVSGRLTLRGVIDQPLLSGARAETEVQARDEVPFCVSRADAWTAAPLARQTPLPGAWALADFQEPDTPDGGLPPGQQRLCFAVDIEKYSARHNADMIRLQRALMRVVRAACARAGVDWDSCGRQAQGDGYLLVLLPDADETRVVPGLMDGVADALAVVNQERGAGSPDNPGLRTRMRAGFHHGIVHEAESGYAGSTVVELFRVLDSDPVRAVLTDDKSTDLAVAFSDRLYQDLAVHGYDGLSPAGFERSEVCVTAKRFTGVAWIRAHPLTKRPLSGPGQPDAN